MILKGKNKREDFMAREYFTSKAITTKADVFSAGVLLYYMLVGEFPFKGGRCLVKLISKKIT